MRLLYRCGVFATVFAIVFSVYVHKYVPEDCPDRLQIQIITDLFSICERLAQVTEAFGYSRWWPYRTKIWNRDHFFNMKNDTKMKWTKFADIESVVVTPGGETSNNRGTVIFLHGGGWVMGSIHGYLDLLVDIAEETGTVVMAPEYRLAPEHPFPVPYEDCLRSTLDYLANSHQYGVDLNKIVIMGDSAGGNLALAVTHELQQLNRNKEISYKVSMQVLIYPYLQTADFLLPSHDTNQKYFISDVMIQQCFLAYAGLDNRMDLAEKVSQNAHVKDERIQKLQKEMLNPDFIEKKYKGDWERKKFEVGLNDEMIEKKLTELVLDIRMSPLLMTDEQLSLLPTTHILVCHYDPLRDDGLLLLGRLDDVGVETSLQYLPNSPHAVMSFGAVIRHGYHFQENQKTFQVIKQHLQN